MLSKLVFSLSEYQTVFNLVNAEDKDCREDGGSFFFRHVYNYLPVTPYLNTPNYVTNFTLMKTINLV